MTCPKCHGEMRVYERSGVTVDQCTECRGLFLDRGELEKLFEAEANWSGPGAPGPQGRPPAPQPGGYAPPPAAPAHGGGYAAPPPPGYGQPAYPAAAPYGTQQPQYAAGHHGHYRQQGHHGHYRGRKKHKGFLNEFFG